MRLPKHGLSRDELFARMKSYRDHDMPWRDGRTWAYVYDAGPEAERVIDEAYVAFLGENALDPTVFPSLRRFENEILAIARDHLSGGPEVVGSFTSGGTESCLLAVKTARDFARATRGIEKPEMVLPTTAHAAFQKAAHYFGVEPKLVPADPTTFRADVAAMRAAIGPNTILLVGSAPSYAHGVIDPIADLGRLALEKGLLFHVDACIGGWVLPYFRRLGAEVAPFDFSVPGVSSMSMDLHKYAFAAKGASVVLYRDKELRKHQIFTCATWSGYTMINPTMQSTKSGGPLAGAWAALHFLGDDGYLDRARRMLEATRRIAAGIETIPGLRLLARPESTLVAFTSDEVSVFHVIDEMKTRRWYVQPQLAFQGSKENIHLSITPASLEHVDAFLADLRASVEAARALPKGQLAASLMDALASVDPSQLDGETLSRMLAMAGIAGGELPERMAEINEVLNALPGELTARVLTEFVNDLFVPAKG